MDELEVPMKEAMLFKSVYKKCPEHTDSHSRIIVVPRGWRRGWGVTVHRCRVSFWGEGS